MSAKAKNKLTPQQRKATLNRVLHKIRPYSAFVVCSLLVAAVSVAAQLYIPILCGSAIDMMLGKGTVDFAGVLRIIYEIIVVAVVAAFAQWLLSVCNNRITFSVSRDLRNEALRKIQTLPLSYLDSHPSGDIVSRMVADVDTFADGLLMGFTQLFTGVVTILGTLLFMLSISWKITLAVVTMDENARVTSAIGDMTEPELSVSADGTVSAPREPVYTKNELGDRYGMRSASALGKEWYEHSAGWCGYLKGKNAVEIGKLSADGTDADLKALCTISVTDLQKAALKAMAEQ